MVVLNIEAIFSSGSLEAMTVYTRGNIINNVKICRDFVKGAISMAKLHTTKSFQGSDTGP